MYYVTVDGIKDCAVVHETTVSITIVDNDGVFIDVDRNDKTVSVCETIDSANQFLFDMMEDVRYEEEKFDIWADDYIGRDIW